MDQLAQPIGLLMRPTFTVDLQDSLELAARKLRDNGVGLLPVTQDGFLAGAITESALSSALAVGMELTDPVEMITKGAPTAKSTMTGAQALRQFDQSSQTALIVIDDGGRVLGVLTPSDLYPKRLVPPRPPLVGGMATPFGVYLTTGYLRAGVGHLALIATGASLFGLLMISQSAAILAASAFTKIGLSATAGSSIKDLLAFIFFLLGMRLLPLSGIHAAEHKVVHAIERGEELVPSVIRRMPRVHPRCGTNLAVGATLFLWLGNASFFASHEISLMIAAVATLALWRPLGNAMQYYVTTKRPTEKQIAMGINSGRELLDKYATTGHGSANFGMRLLNSGMFHVMAGSLLMIGLTELIVYLFHLPFDPLNG
jgi:CBS domain-containing protein